MSDNFVHLLILLGVAGGAIPTRQATTSEARPIPAAAIVACRSATASGALRQANVPARPCQEQTIQTKQR